MAPDGSRLLLAAFLGSSLQLSVAPPLKSGYGPHPLDKVFGAFMCFLSLSLAEFWTPFKVNRSVL